MRGDRLSRGIFRCGVLMTGGVSSTGSTGSSDDEAAPISIGMPVSSAVPPIDPVMSSGSLLLSAGRPATGPAAGSATAGSIVVLPVIAGSGAVSGRARSDGTGAAFTGESRQVEQPLQFVGAPQRCLNKKVPPLRMPVLLEQWPVRGRSDVSQTRPRFFRRTKRQKQNDNGEGYAAH